MGETALTIACGVAIFGTGFVWGAKWQHKRVVKQVRAAQPIVVNLVGEYITKIARQELTETELKERIAEDMDFIKIISQD